MRQSGSFFPRWLARRRIFVCLFELPLLSRRRGGCTIKEMARSLISSCRRGGVVQEILDHTTPSAPLKVASLLFLDVASTPPRLRRGADCCAKETLDMGDAIT